MVSSLARVILTVLGGYVIIMFLLIAYEWIEEEYPSPPSQSPNTARIQHPYYHEQAVDALQQFSRLPVPERTAIKDSLSGSLVSMDQWMSLIDRSNYSFICIGELHKESTRKFLAEELFTQFSVDVLMLEATPKQLKRLTKRVNVGRTYFPLLGADIMSILRAIRAKNPSIKICGIEETEKQQKNGRGFSGSRDHSIARNFWNRFQPGQRNIILIGALHCINESNWLFDLLYEEAPSFLKKQMLNVQVIGEHQKGPVEAFVYFLDEIGIEKKSFVIPDTRALHPRIYEFFQTLERQTLEKFRALVVFRT